MKKLSFFISFAVLLIAAFLVAEPSKPREVTAQAQPEMCPQIVTYALETTAQACSGTARNRACYGHALLEAEPVANASRFSFQQVGDQVDVESIRALRLSPFDLAQDFWGIALMRLQANLPAANPGANVTVLMFGNVNIWNAVTEKPSVDEPSLDRFPFDAGERESLTAMQAFYFESDDDTMLCPEVPASGLVIQTPEGIARVRLWVNGVRIDLGSTAYLRATSGESMSVSLVEGSAQISTARGNSVAIAGSQVVIDVDQTMNAVGMPSLPQAYTATEINPTLFTYLERPITPARPLTDYEVMLLRQQVINGEAICGVAPYPRCPDTTIEGTVQSINGNVVTVNNIPITFDPNDPTPSTLYVGQPVTIAIATNDDGSLTPLDVTPVHIPPPSNPNAGNPPSGGNNNPPPAGGNTPPRPPAGMGNDGMGNDGMGGMGDDGMGGMGNNGMGGMGDDDDHDHNHHHGMGGMGNDN